MGYKCINSSRFTYVGYLHLYTTTLFYGENEFFSDLSIHFRLKISAAWNRNILC